MTGDWRHRAACAGYATGWWHSDNAADKQDAKDICATCPVTANCLADADRWGIWGGLDAAERETVARRQARLRQDRERKQRQRRDTLDDAVAEPRRTPRPVHNLVDIAAFPVDHAQDGDPVTMWTDRLDARISRCDCGSWRWDGRCPVCDFTVPSAPSKEKVA